MLKKPDPDLQYLLWLTEVAALSPVKGVRLLEAFGSAKAIWDLKTEKLFLQSVLNLHFITV